MKHPITTCTALLAFTGLFTFSAHAVLRNDGGIGDPVDIPGAVRVLTGLSFGSGTVVGDGTWVLTAGHVLDNGMSGSSYSFVNQDGTTVVGMGTVIRVVDATDTRDWGLVHLSSALPGAIALYNGNPSVGDQIYFAGWGRSDPTPGSGNASIASGTARQGENVLNFVDTTRFALGFDFDLTDATNAFPATTINGQNVADDGRANSRGGSEATTFAGDSGMGYFETIGGIEYLVGVHDGITDATALNKDQVESYGTTVNAFYGQIITMIPEPGSFSLIMLGLGMVMVKRKRLSTANLR